MKNLIFSIYRSIRSVSFISILIILITVIPLFAIAADTISPTLAGFVCEEMDDSSVQKIRAYLLDNGFIELDNVDELYSEVADGNLDCGVVVPAGIQSRLRTGDLDGLLLFIDSPTALRSDLWREFAAAAVYSVYAPYITADILADSGIELDEVLEVYDHMMASGYLFTFEIETVSGASEPEQIRKTQFTLLASAVLIFIGVIFGVCIPVVSDLNTMIMRIGARRTIKYLFIPQVIIRNLLIWLAGGIGVWITGFMSHIPMLGIYIILINCAGFILLFIFRGKTWLQIYTTLICIATVALCPIFIDIALFVPVVGYLRQLCPTYWLWMIHANAELGLIFGIISICLTIAVLILSFHRRRIQF